ncbi:iron ABC transporter permease [Shimwellia pseudoproteus]|uniref:FecCD family ABC transporter permease n=1 Tax=Shimwellia pseudoproteus TaxID=570012 RepID=UPI0018ECAB82|nr:iron ABC transporter permease [Shimwellia pseudoproteus]MBJ3814918.1 iron ABC transporter permease [Shimwellia pseudoproteus]
MSIPGVNKPARHWRPGRTFAALGGLLVAAAGYHVLLGASAVSLQTVWQALFHYDPTRFPQRILVDLRLLRLCAAALTGAALGIAGLLLQAVIRNPLGEPHILGLNAGAALAVVAATASGAGWFALPFARPLAAAGGAALLFSLVMGLSSAGRTGLTPLNVTLCGVALSAFASSLTAAILILDEQTLQSIRLWLAGDLSGLHWATLKYACWPLITGAGMAIYLAPSLTMLALGDQAASGLGVNLLRTRLLTMLAVALLCGAAVSIAGPIGFIGLVVPNIIRRRVTDDVRQAVPLCAAGGALLLIVADILARTLIAPQELATGLMTAFAGAPVFIWLAARWCR